MASSSNGCRSTRSPKHVTLWPARVAARTLQVSYGAASDRRGSSAPLKATGRRRRPRCTAASAVAKPILPVMPFTITGTGSTTAAAWHAKRSLRPAAVRCAREQVAPRAARVRTLGCCGVRTDKLQPRCIAAAERSWWRETGGRAASRPRGPACLVHVHASAQQPVRTVLNECADDERKGRACNSVALHKLFRGPCDSRRALR